MEEFGRPCYLGDRCRSKQAQYGLLRPRSVFLGSHPNTPLPFTINRHFVAMADSSVRILVAIENPSSEHGLVSMAAALARARGGDLYLTHVLTPARQHEAASAREQLERAVELADELGIRAYPNLVEGPSVTEAILTTIRHHECDTILMGWYNDVDRDSVLGSENRMLTKLLDVDMLIFKERSTAPPERILVPTSGGSHSLVGVQVADDLASAWNASLQIVRVARDRELRSRQPLLRRHCEQVREDTELQLKLMNVTAPIEVVPSAEIVRPIVERSRSTDLLVLGASNDWRQEDYLAGSIPDEIAYQVPSSVLMVRSRAAHSPRLSNIFWEHTIRLNLHPKDKWEALEQMIDVLVEEKQVPQSQRNNILAAARAREQKSPTALGHETAVPHARIANLPGVIGVMGICPNGVDFGAGGDLVRYLFLLLTPEENYRSYIPILAQIATLMHSDEIRAAFLRCETPAELVAAIKTHTSS